MLNIGYLTAVFGGYGASTPATNQAIAHLLKEINQTETDFPGTDLTMVFESHIPNQNHKTGDT